ncbi:hypothetical protein DRN85_07575 [Methanosarcinales archaeon]|nr:MAG: hypothetical protein DRN85_07575 [Methanosarcinales archaeon]
MSWEIYIDDELVDAQLEKIVDELDGIKYAQFYLPNNDVNRELVASDRLVVIKYDGETIFEGTLTGAKYEATSLKCIAYDTVYYNMDGKVHSGDYTSTPANTILSDICSSAGVNAGECPSDALSVKFINTDCWVAATFLAYCLNKDFWTSDGDTFNIGDKGEDRGEITPTSIGRREVDRARIYNKVIVRGYDKDGNELVVEASTGSGDRAKVFFERKATDLATLQNIAQKKLSELSTDAIGSKITLTVDDGVSLNSGDTITINDELRNLSSSYRIARIIKKMEKVEVELEVKEKTITDYLRDEFSNLEDLGIYLVSSHLEVPSGTSFPSNPSEGQLFYRTDLDACFRYNGSSWDKITKTSGEGTSFPSNPSVGDVFYRTDEGKFYRWDGSSWVFIATPNLSNMSGDLDDISDGSSKKTIEVVSSLPNASLYTGKYVYVTGGVNAGKTFYSDGSKWIPQEPLASYRYQKHYRLTGESIDGYDVTAEGTTSVDVGVGRITISATGTDGRIVVATADDILHTDRNPSFKAKITVTNTGSWPEVDLIISCANSFGFVLDDTTIYALEPGGSLISLMSYSVNTPYVLECIFDGSSVKYFVNDVLEHTTTNLPSSSPADFHMLVDEGASGATFTLEIEYVDIFEKWSS